MEMGCGGRCDRAEDFTVDAGQLSLLGPAARQDRTCLSGQTCSVDNIVGIELADTDRVAILDTCGTADVDVPNAPTEFYVLEGPPRLDRLSLGGFSPTLLTSGKTWHWGSGRVSAKGGQYRLCCVTHGNSAKLKAGKPF